MSIAATVKTFLDDHAIDYELVPHRKAYTCSELARAAHVDSDHIAKGVILKTDHGYTMAVIPGGHWLRLRAVRRDLGASLELAGEDEFEPLFRDCDRGAVPAIGQAYGVDTVVDDALDTLGDVYIEAGDHEHLVHMNGDAFRMLMRGARHGHYTHHP